VIRNYRDEIIEAVDWLDKGLLEWSHDIIRIDEVIEKRQEIIK
jgi:hypothetical protein